MFPERIPSLTALYLVLSLFCIGLCSAGERFPYDLAVDVRLGTGMAMESMREELEHALLDDPGLHACYLSVKPSAEFEGAERPDLVLRITLLDMVEEIRHEQSVAGYTRSQDPEDALKVYVILRLKATFEILIPGGEGPLRSSNFHKRVTERPNYQGQDSRFDARMRILDESVRRSRKMACTLSRKELERALAAEPSPR